MYTATLDARHFADALRTVEIVRQNSHIQIISVAIARFGPRSALVATDLDMQLTVPLQAAVSAPFGVAVYPPVAITALGGGHGEITLSRDGEEARLQAGHACVTPPGALDPADFPDLDTTIPAPAPSDCSTTLSEGVLHEAIRATRFAMSTEETRYYLNGALLTGVEGAMTLVASDGHRLARHDLTRDYAGPDVIIPASAIHALHKLTRSDSQRPIVITVVRVRKGDGQKTRDHFALLFEAEGWSLRSRAIDGQYPAWHKIQDKTAEEIGESPAITARITQAQISRLPKPDGFSGCFYHADCVIDPADGTMRAMDAAGQEVATVPVTGTGPAVCINLQYLRHMVNAIGDFTLEGSAPRNPLLARSPDQRTSLILMPKAMPTPSTQPRTP